MIDIDINKIKNDSHNVYHNLLIETARHSDSDPKLLKAIENISLQMNNIIQVIEYLMEGKING